MSKAAAYLAAAPLVLGGGSALIAKSAIFAMISAIMSAAGDDRDPEKMVYDTIREHFGDEGEGFARGGLMSLANLDISGSLLIDFAMPKEVSQLTGAIGGVFGDVMDTANFISTGQVGRAFETLLPIGIGNWVRAGRELSGVTTRKGRTVFDKDNRPFKPTAGETGRRVAGFRSARSASVQARQWEKTRETKKFNDKRSKIYERYRSYLASKNLSQYRKVLKEMKAYNAQVRKLGPKSGIPQITKESLKRQAKGMRRPSKRKRL
jgi:hypothetical protein